jgi:hypothetical protein
MPEQRMSAHLTRIAKKRGRLPALVTALSLGGLLALQSFLHGLIWFARNAARPLQPGTESGLYEYNAYSFQPSIDELLFFILPVTLGVFLALWAIAPISHELTLRFVLTRAVLASACGVILVMIVQIAGAVLTLFGGSVTAFVQRVFDALSTGASAFVSTTPLVLLACVLLWLWLRDHPRDYEVAGLVDEL